MEKSAKIYIAGHRGLVGSAIVRKLEAEGYSNIVVKTRQELDLTDSIAVAEFFVAEKPEYVFMAAAKVGGILANNDNGAEFIYQNLMIQNNVIHNAYLNNVKKLLFLGTSCIYPKMAPQPIKEESFLDGRLEETNKPYAVAKIAGITMCQAYNKQYGTNYICPMPTNIYGPNDDFNLTTCHLIPAALRKAYEAKKNNAPSITVWGTGTPMREGLYVDDLADACLFLMDNYNDSEIINVGTGVDATVKDIMLTAMKVVGYEGEMVLDSTKPDGTPKKQLDVSKINALGWKAEHDLESGLRKTLEWLESHPEALT
jgi:GDP-L-fucose synthase